MLLKSVCVRGGKLPVFFSVAPSGPGSDGAAEMVRAESWGHRWGGLWPSFVKCTHPLTGKGAARALARKRYARPRNCGGRSVLLKLFRPHHF